MKLSELSFATAAADAEGDSLDAVCRTADIVVSPPMAGEVLPSLILPIAGTPRLPLGQRANAQLATRLGIPSAFSLDCSERFPDTWATVLSEYIQDVPTEGPSSMTMIRARGGMAQAALSGSYLRVDSARVLAGIQGQGLALDALGADYGDGSLRMALLNRKDNVSPFDGEVLFAGLSITADDWGLGALSAKLLLYRQWCSNGATISLGTFGVVRREHRGPRRLEAGILPALEDAEGQTLEDWLVGLNGAAGGILADAGDGRIGNVLARAADAKAKDSVATWAALAKVARLSDAETAFGWAKASTDVHAPETAWAFANALTNVANGRKGSAATALENMGGGILGLDQTWRMAGVATLDRDARAKALDGWKLGK